MTTPHEKSHLEYMQELMAKQEDLRPELAPWLDMDGPFGPSLRHPLVFSIVHPPTMNAYVNAMFDQKKAALRRAKLEGKWSTCVWLYERPYRIDAFMDISWHLSGPDYWELLGRVWVDCENSHQNLDTWREALTADPEGREMMSDPDLRCVFELTPEQGGLLPQTRIYRGYRFEEGLDGFAWTLDRSRAKWFANRLRTDDQPSAKVASGYVAKENVIAYINSRDESELVVLPEHVTELEIEEL